MRFFSLALELVVSLSAAACGGEATRHVAGLSNGAAGNAASGASGGSMLDNGGSNGGSSTGAAAGEEGVNLGGESTVGTGGSGSGMSLGDCAPPSGTAPNDSVAGAAGAPSGSPGIAVSIAAGFYHTCALLADGTVECWGDNSVDQLGVGAKSCLLSSAVPLRVMGLSSVVGLAAGPLHTCALLADGTVKCWGEDPARAADTERACDRRRSMLGVRAPHRRHGRLLGRQFQRRPRQRHRSDLARAGSGRAVRRRAPQLAAAWGGA